MRRGSKNLAPNILYIVSPACRILFASADVVLLWRGTRFVLLVRYLQNEPIRGALSQRCRTLHTGLLVLHLRSGDFNKSYRHVAK